MKIVMFKLISLIGIFLLFGCSGTLLELSNIRAEVIERLDSVKLIPDDQKLPQNVRESSSLSIIKFDYQKEMLKSFPDEGGALKIEFLRCSSGELGEATFVYADKVNISLSDNKRNVLLDAKNTYFFADSSSLEDGCFRLTFKSMARTLKSAVYELY